MFHLVETPGAQSAQVDVLQCLHASKNGLLHFHTSLLDKYNTYEKLSISVFL